MKVDDILVSWVIPTFDRRIKGPMPPPTLYYELDWTKASGNEQAEIIEILGISDNSKKEEFVGLGKQSETFSIGATNLHERMLQFRQMFVGKSTDHLKRLTSDSKIRVFTGVNINRDYFEDETGQEISVQEMIQIVEGNKNLILFDVENIAKIGPTDICSVEKWTVDKANILFNFIQVVRVIWRSSWFRKSPTITMSSGSIVKSDFPTVENMCSILTLFRQLYAPSDKLMKEVCEVYGEHSSNATKKIWVSDCLKRFNQSLDTIPFFIQSQKCTTKDLFDAFLYGTGMVHSPENRNSKHRDALSKVVEQCGREKVIMAVNESFRRAFQCAVDVFHIVKQDYEHWTKRNGRKKSNMFDIYSLLRSHSP